MLEYSVIDIEAPGLNPDHLHCMSVKEYSVSGIRKFSLTDPEEIKKYITSVKTIVGHNFIRWDAPTIERVLGCKITARIIDTLALSWYLFPLEEVHGLAEYGVQYGVPKPIVEDWYNEPIEVYVHRCEVDVEINDWAFNKMKDALNILYDGNSDNIDRIVNYLMFKMDCAREQEEVKWKLDIERATRVYDQVLRDYEEKLRALAEVMPSQKIYAVRKRPKIMFKADGELSAHGVKWLEKLDRYGLDENVGEIKEIVKEKIANAGSSAQVKDWLFSLGWIPINFKYTKTKDKETGLEITNKVPQVNVDGKICPSIKLMFEQYPELKILEGVTVLKDRKGILHRFLENVDENGFLQAKIAGFTNTLRFKHTEIVNLPTIHKPYGKDIRGCLLASDGEVLCGSDMSSLEDNTKQHYMYFYDPAYVQEQRTPGFDPHLSIAEFADIISTDEINFFKHYHGTPYSLEKLPTYKEKGLTGLIFDQLLALTPEEQKEKIELISKNRKDLKQVNFSAVYGVGAPKLSLTTGWTISKSKGLLEAYWGKNWSVKKIAKDVTTKTIGTQMWLWNPVSHFWYSLRFDKDKFSTLNQGTGVYCFDTWVKKVRKKGYKICGQFHDEIISPTKIGNEEVMRKDLKEAIKEANEELKLNVELGISVDFGYTYADIH